MNITICNRQFNTEDINYITITESTVFVDTFDDFYRIRYTNESEIEEAQSYVKFKELKVKELMDAVMTLILVCDKFINSKTQCLMCPLKRNNGCVFNSNPIDWRY